MRTYEIEISKVNSLDMLKEEEAAVEWKIAFKSTITEIKVNHMTQLAMAGDTFPGTKVCSLVPRFYLKLRTSTKLRATGNGKAVLELE